MKTLKQFRPMLLATAITMGLCAFGASVMAAPGGTPGKPANPGGDGDSEPPDLGDLFVLYRDADGVPILTTDSCQRPLAADGTVIPVDPATCAVLPEYATLTQEVDFGRTSVVRSPETVLQQQLQDVIVNLSTAGCVTLDPAGRLVTSTNTDGVITSGAIDSPLQNLAIYRQLMLTGDLGISLTDPNNVLGNVLDTAARGVGAAADKSGKVSVDMVVYLNQIVGLTDESVTTYLPKKCINVKEEVKGVVQMVRKCFLDYGNYNYNRTANFISLPNPPYIPDGNPQPGWFEYLKVLDSTPTFGIVEGPILDAIPELMGNPNLTAFNIVGFAQAADDTRAVIDFMHTWPLPSDYATPLTCDASSGATYDVSISEQSGLQVPVQMVDGTEGREFTVTVANAGPNSATGTVTVTAVAANGATIAGSPWTFNFNNLAAGASQSFIQLFSINVGARTTITWTATVNASNDVNTGNNSVTETTNVKVTGRGGQGGRS
ncbi:hypothetical protein [Methylomonas sp. MgM2]